MKEACKMTQNDQNKPLLQIEDLRVSFDTYAGTVQAVRGVDIEVRPGEVLAMVGSCG